MGNDHDDDTAWPGDERRASGAGIVQHSNVAPPRARTRHLPPPAGVRTSLWLDRANFVVMVRDQQYRSMPMIDAVCLAIEPLGGTLAVVVNVQDVTAKNPDAATTLSRNCQLQEGERAFLLAKREVDVVPKETRERFKAMKRRCALSKCDLADRWKRAKRHASA